MFVVKSITSALVFAILWPQATLPQQSGTSEGEDPVALVAEATTFYREGKFDKAAEEYQRILKLDPRNSAAYAGLGRTYLKQEHLTEATDTLTKGLQTADSPTLRVALAELYFRQGRIPEADREWVNVINSGHPEARAYLGLYRLNRAVSMHKRARTMISQAYKMDPKDPEIYEDWIFTLDREERIKHLEVFLDSPNNNDAEEQQASRHYLEYLKARQKSSYGSCRLAGKVSSTETPLVPLLLDPRHLRGLGLTVFVNDAKANLMLDTGASGIVVNRAIAEKSGLVRLSNMQVGGIGDKGEKPGWVGLATKLRIGGLEFQNCEVSVVDQRSVVGEAGLIGADVFDDFLVELNFPARIMRLTPLPSRPGEVQQPVGLQVDEDNDGSTPDEPDALNPSKPGEVKKTRPQPADRYIAPEMQSYTPVFRFGHNLLVPTALNGKVRKLFLLDSGSFQNTITPAAAREVTKVHGDDTVVEGVSGTVKNVYSADKLVLQFGRLRQENLDIISFDFSHVSHAVGTEISGTLGFVLLNMLDVKIDYRDGLVDFSYNDKPLH